MVTFAVLMAAPAFGRSSADSLPSPLRSSVTGPGLAEEARLHLLQVRDAGRGGDRFARCGDDLFQFVHRKRKGALASPLSVYVASGTEARFCLLDDLAERRLVEHREVGEDLAVHVDAGLLEARHELAVRHARSRAPALMRVIHSERNSRFLLRRSR
jgi:hypothetical protein